MAKRRSSKGLPLEWLGVWKTVTAGGGNVVEALDFDLDDDEVAEILQVDSSIRIESAYPIADGDMDGELALTMDSGFSTTNAPFTESVFEDLETIYTHRYSVLVDITTNPSHTVYRTDEKNLVFSPGVLIAAPMGLLLFDDTGVDVNYALRVYFKRRKASDVEIARTLLKRR